MADRRSQRRILCRSLAALLAASAWSGIGSTTIVAGEPVVTSLDGGPACAAETTRTLVATDGMVAERIYRQELVGPEAVHDSRQVEGYAPLLSALAEHSRARIHAAVVSLVYSHTHIVRLRVSQNGRLLSDVGGPYIIAPVGGRLRFHGRPVGSFLLSVQDDLGFVGLETRLIGVPVALFVGNARLPVKGTLRTGPLPSRGTVTIGQDSFQAYTFDARAYPTGTLRISLLRPQAHASSRSCAAVKLSEIGRIGRAIWRRFMLDGSPITGFVDFARAHTGALTYVRAGAKQIAGSTEPGPRRLPVSGPLKYRGVTYGVTSFASRSPSAGAVRVYQLVAL